MNITVLTDNNTFIDRYLLAEPGLSFYIEDGSTRILFDCGYSDVFLRNAAALRIDLTQLDYLVLSHSHLDHTWGLMDWVRMMGSARFENRLLQKPQLVTHPRTFMATAAEPVGEIGSMLTVKSLSSYLQLMPSAVPVALTDRIIFLGQIPRTMDFEPSMAIGRKEGESQGDDLSEDSALVYAGDSGLVVITGCSHAGICNIVEYARKVCGDSRVVDVIGGFHLLQPSPSQLAGTLSYLAKLNLSALHACHCTDLASKIALAAVAPLQETGVGLTLQYP